MFKWKIDTISFVFLIAVMSSGIFAFAADKPEDNYHMQQMPALNNYSGSEFEREFLNMMINHHRDGIEMASLVLKKAEHPELRKAAEKIVIDQQKEVEMMTKWLGEWYNQSATEIKNSKYESESEKLKSLKGADLDREFLKDMYHHHGDAIMMAHLVLRSSIKSP